jgi:uncharacterized protein (TIGR02302 family)
MKPTGEVERLSQHLAGRRAQARAAILFERVWPAIWPALGVAGLFLVAALLDIPRMLPPWAHLTLLAVTGLAVLGLLGRGLARVRRPDAAAADRRLERASGLAHRPLAVLADRPAHDDAAGQALWAAHVGRAMAQVGRLRVGRPSPGLARHDRRALRAALVVALVAAVVIAGPDAPARLAQAFQPRLPHVGAAAATQVQAWITPPAYTGLPPLFLHPQGGAATVPAGGHLTVSVTGGTEAPTLQADSQSVPFRALDATSFQADRDLTAGGRLTVRRDGEELAAWDLTVIADRPPTVAWADPPGQSPRSLQLRLPWAVSDDYGVVGLQAELHLVQRPDAPPLVIGIPLPGGDPKLAKGVSLQDLTADPWAGLAVTGRLVARDAPGQTASSDDAGFVLPERVFRNPLAQLLIGVRKQLSLRPDDRDTAIGRLADAMDTPAAQTDDYGAFVNLGAIAALLAFDPTPAAVPDAQDRLWRLALHLEDGRTDRTARALEAARQAARQALDKATHDPSAQNRAELDRRLQALEDAIQRHIDALMDEAKRSDSETQEDAQSQQMDAREMQRRAEAAREAARQGRMQDAQQQMAELEKMLEDLQNARGQSGQDAQRNAAQRQRGRQQMGALQDMVARQGGLLDHAQGRTQPSGDPMNAVPQTDGLPGGFPGGFPGGMPGGSPDGQPQPQPQPGDQAAREADRRVQQALRRALGELMQQFGDLTGKVPGSLSDADQAMRDAAQALADGKDRTAGTAEQAAIAALQKGGREMGQTMASQFGRGQPGAEGDGEEQYGADGLTPGDSPGDGAGRPGRHGRGDRDDGRDPLGRRYGSGATGADESADVAIPEQRERQRTQAIQEELRRRGAERDRPQEELDYIDRLLKRF